MTYDYHDSTVVLGPLATVSEPNSYDMCDEHARHLTAPKGWQVVRLVTDFEPSPPSGDDLLALVDAVRRAADAPSLDASAPADDHGPAHMARVRHEEARTDVPAERGPFAVRLTAEPDTSNPLAPSSPYAQRRARFQVVSDRKQN